jgi:hypothetical protein
MRRYYEFALVVVLISVCVLLAVGALSRAQDDAEEARMQAEVMSMRGQLMEVAVHRETFGGRLPQSDNPMEWIAECPVGYRGAFNEPPAERGVWYFDNVAKELIYLFRDGRAARFRLTRNAGAEGSRSVPGGIGLMRIADKPQG